MSPSRIAYGCVLFHRPECGRHSALADPKNSPVSPILLRVLFLAWHGAGSSCEALRRRRHGMCGIFLAKHEIRRRTGAASLSSPLFKIMSPLEFSGIPCSFSKETGPARVRAVLASFLTGSLRVEKSAREPDELILSRSRVGSETEAKGQIIGL